MPEVVEDDNEFGTVDDEEVVDAGTADVEMDVRDDEGIPEHQEVDPEVQEALDNAVEEGSATQYDSHKEAIEAATGNDGEDEEKESVDDSGPSPEDYMMDEDEVDDYNDDNGEEDETENLPDATSEDVGMKDGEMDFSALKSTEQVTETVNRGNEEFDFVFEEPEESDDEIINMIRDRQGQDRNQIDEAEVEGELRREAVEKTLVSPSPDVVMPQWDDFSGAVRLQLGGRALQVLGLMDFIRASGAGPQVQQEG